MPLYKSSGLHPRNLHQVFFSLRPSKRQKKKNGNFSNTTPTNNRNKPFYATVSYKTKQRLRKICPDLTMGRNRLKTIRPRTGDLCVRHPLQNQRPSEFASPRYGKRPDQNNTLLNTPQHLPNSLRNPPPPPPPAQNCMCA